ncbi:MAG: bifunctional demethylmenaquinone methyltransferase/2-methoxy-6-polyprenyl-1,4-benzoquinol methylase UbiE [Planctomycetaceae bacterium]
MNATASTLEKPATTLDKSGERVQRMFGEIAKNYDLMNHLLSMNVDRYWRWWTVRQLKPQGTTPILDMCTGTGDLALAFHSYMKGSAPITAADFCPEMLAIGEQKKIKRGISDKITFVQADAQQLPFADDTFQIVSVAFGLRNVADTDKGLREMTRVCKPGGRVAVLEFSTPTWQPFKGFYGWYFRNVLPRIGQFFAKNDSSAYSYLPESVGQFPQGKALCKRMHDAGLTQTEFHTLTFGIATLYIGVKPCTPKS